MRADMTLGEIKAYCARLTAEHGDNSCRFCDFVECGCCESPNEWILSEEDAPTPVAQPDWEAKCHELEDALAAVQFDLTTAVEENERLRLIISTIETMLGRKF